MLAAARKVLLSRPALWVAAGTSALLAAIPQALAVTAGAAGGVAFLLTGDAALALEIWKRTPGLSAPVAAAGGVFLLMGFASWVRLHAIAVYLSRPEEERSWREAVRATRGTWLRATLLHLHAYAALALVVIALGLAAAVAAPSAFGTLVLLALLAFLIARTAVRIVLSVALRAVVLDGLSATAAWRTGARFVRAKRHDVAIAWVGLVAIGVSVWIGGRLITPVLQDTTYDYPATSGYEAARQAIQLLVAVPLETLLFALGVAVWTAVYDGVEPAPVDATRRAEPEPWVRKALAAALVIAIVGNGGATLVEDAFRAARAEEEERVTERALKPEEAVGPASATAPASGDERTAYAVDAVLDGEQLSWVTTIDYLNDTGERLRDVGINVYPNAYTRPLRDVPFARDLVAADFNGEFQALARAGEMEEFEVAVDGREVPATLRDTSVLVDLGRAVGPGDRTEIRIVMRMELPRFPERFGRWNDLTLLGNWIPTVAVREPGAWRLDPFGSIGDPFLSEVADYDVAITVDENAAVVGTGTLVAVADSGAGRREWRFDAPAVRDAAFATGAFLRGLEAEAAGTVVRSWYPPGAGRAGAGNLDAARSAVAYYTSAYGPLPWPEVEVVATEGRLGGMEYPGVVFVSSASEPFAGLPLLPDLVEYSGFEDARARYVVGHELAHQWWFASAGNDQIEEPWLDEALAEASTRLWLRAEEDDGDRTWLMTNLVTGADASAEAVSRGIGDFSSNEEYTRGIYLEGSEVLMELRRSVGPETFDAILREWHETQSQEIGSLEEFAATVRRVAGPRAAAFLDEYF